MSRKFLPLAAAAAIGLSPAGAIAADEGPYVGLGMGLALVADSAAKGQRTEQYPTPLDAEVAIVQGAALHAALGYGFANGLRIEAEMGWRENDLRRIAVKQPGSLANVLPATLRPLAGRILAGSHPLDGTVRALSLTANVYYDIGMGGKWTPYVGGGGGLARISVKANSRDAQLPAALGGVTIPGRLLLDDEDWVFTYQFGGGIGRQFDVSSGRPIIVSVDYRYRATADPSFTGAVTQTGLEAEQSAHYIGLGVRFGFDLGS